MKVIQILIADYANVSREGKLNVLGIFGNINAKIFPVVHPQLHLVVLWEASRAESGKKKELEVQLSDADGTKLFSVGVQFQIPTGPSGKKISGNYVLVLNGIKFDRPGDYEFNILINGDHKGEAPFSVTQPRGSK